LTVTFQAQVLLLETTLKIHIFFTCISTPLI